MKVRTILSFLLGAIMFGGFLAQMWDLFVQFHSGLKTISVSFEEKSVVEFPSIAICDSRAFRKLVPWTANAGRYNATTFNLEGQVSLNTFQVFQVRPEETLKNSGRVSEFFGVLHTLHQSYIYLPTCWVDLN